MTLYMQRYKFNGKLDSIILNTFGRLKHVLVLVEEGNGSNRLVKTKRGPKYKDMSLPDTTEHNAESAAGQNASVVTAGNPPPTNFNTFDLLRHQSARGR